VLVWDQGQEARRETAEAAEKRMRGGVEVEVAEEDEQEVVALS
jgi:hypothetical protein